jgi:hypothetical protein
LGRSFGVRLFRCADVTITAIHRGIAATLRGT